MPAELEVDGSDLRLQRADLTFTGSPPKAHEAYAIAVVEPPLQENQIGPALEDTRNYVEDVLQASGRTAREQVYEAVNWRSSTFNRSGWIMFLVFPLDYLHYHFIAHAVSLFGKLLHWHEHDRIKGRVLC